ncbi:MAG: hypothetical protein JST76_04090 [Bacteroidetes bacterium]|nr:hypothetical protein [Bacteroidota bacterium]MBS1617672.1 hypothetical protein [Bacteroidota bacterium]
MKKTILICTSLILLAIGMGSCKKCYMCTLSQKSQTQSGSDTSIVLKSELCNKGTEGAGHNLKSAVADEERNGYTCVPE